MKGVEWVIPVVVFIVYVVSAILKAREEAADKPGVRAAGQRNGGSELDRFLEEIERLKREQAAKQQQQPEPRSAPDYVEPAIIVPRVSRPMVVRQVAQPVAEPAPVKVVAARSLDRIAESVIQAPPKVRDAAIKPIAEMLRSPQGIAQALMLQEVLGPPKSRRR